MEDTAVDVPVICSRHEHACFDVVLLLTKASCNGLQHTGDIPCRVSGCNTALLALANEGIPLLLLCCLGVGIRPVEEGSLSGSAQGAAEPPERGETVHPPLL